ncbi:c-type cytochrome [Roseobacter sp. MH60115]|uniref:c-type cytochrome n=1 Tax=Roseobacter sp. MH60115 TaxID=2785324 RepID=UPI0018A337B4|nr:cytochrome c family protein [Roseobacter sp. MH60115]
MLKTFLVTACLMTLPAMAFADGHVTGDAEKGEKVFRKCKACHAVGEGAENKVGPVLNGIVDRAFGAVDGFSYSDALMEAAAEGKAWTPEELDAFLQKPRSYLKGTKMSFAGLRKDDDRANVIAYLASFPGEGS